MEKKRRIYLLRHAMAASSFEFADKERPLTDQGRAQAVRMGQLMREKGFLPEQVYCSPARRTTETLYGLQLGLTENNIAFPPALYNGDESVFAQLIAGTDDEKNSILLIGHNPGIFNIAYAYTKHSDEHVLFSYDICMLVALTGGWESWANVSPAQITNIQQFRP